MSVKRVMAPVIEPGQQVKGPSSYFPSIEKTYGKPMQEWFDLIAPELETKRHMEVVDWLKAEHSVGHGHANAMVAYVKAKLDAPSA